MKAYRVWCDSLDGSGISFGRTAGSARYRAYLSNKDAYPNVGLTDIRVRRAPEYDGHGSATQRNHGCWIPELLKPATVDVREVSDED